MTTKTFARNMGQLRIDPDQSGLVAGYDMVPRADGTIEDLSGNGNHGTINGPVFEFTEIGPSMRYAADGETVVTTYTGAPAAFSISGWWNLKSSGQGTFGRLFSKGTDILELFANNSAIDLNLRYENGSGVQNAVISDGYTQDLECHIVLTYASGSIKVYLNNVLVETITDSIVLDASALVIGNLSVNAMDGNISNLKFLDRELTVAEIQAEYQAGANAVNFKTAYGAAESAAAESAPGELSNTPFRIESGTWKISTDTINGCSAKVIECVTAGAVQIPTGYLHGDDTQAAHGSFEWWMYKGAGGTSPKFVLIANQPTVVSVAGMNGYDFRFAGDESLRLYRNTNGVGTPIVQSAGSAILINTWYMLKVTISAKGEFTMYLNGSLISAVAGSNPITDTTYTESKYLVLDLDAGDKVAYAAKNGDCSIVKYEGIV